MPIYEYRCLDCGRKFEILQPMGERSESIGCECGDKSHLERVFSTFAPQTVESTECNPDGS